MQAVTLDFARARNVRCRRAIGECADLKREAHRRVRTKIRAWLRTGDPDEPPVVRPVTGRDVC